MKAFFVATRPWSFTMSWVSVAVGTLVAWQEARVSWTGFVLTLAGVTLVHGATNAINDFFDTEYGVDTPQAPTAKYRPHPIFERILSPRGLLAEAVFLYAVGGVIWLVLVFEYSFWVFWLGLGGVLISFFYTAKPIAVKYIALGEVGVFLAWGPLMVEGAYAVQRNALSSKALLVSFPVGLLVALVLFANNARDIDFDASKKILTSGILLGQNKSRIGFIAMIFLAYLLVGLMTALGLLGLWGLLPFLSIPAALKISKDFFRGFPDAADALTARFHLAFGSLLCLGLFMEGVFKG